jgi:hypothetical protein
MGRIHGRGLVEYILDEMMECVEQGNFVVKQTDKNEEFAFEFSLTTELKRNILLALKVEDYFNSDESRNFPGRYIHEFCPKYSLCNMEGNEEVVDVYVKFEVEEENTGKQTVVVSLHRAEKEVHFAYGR